MHTKVKDKGINVGLVLRQTAGLPFYNTSQYSLATLGATKTKSNLEAYIAGFSDNARVIFDQFNFIDTIARLARADNLFKICQSCLRDSSPRDGIDGTLVLGRRLLPRVAAELGIQNAMDYGPSRARGGSRRRRRDTSASSAH
jgi:hypothetical protein